MLVSGGKKVFIMRLSKPWNFAFFHWFPAAASLIAVLFAGGCSIDLGTFDTAGLGFMDEERGEVGSTKVAYTPRGTRADYVRPRAFGPESGRPHRDDTRHDSRTDQDTEISQRLLPDITPHPEPDISVVRRMSEPKEDKRPEAWGRHYILKSGETLSAVARRHGIALTELQRLNKISDVDRVAAGTVIKVPRWPQSETSPHSVLAEKLPPETRQDLELDARPLTQSSEETLLRSGEDETSSLQSSTEDTASGSSEPETAAMASSDKADSETTTPLVALTPSSIDTERMGLRWPVKGRIVSSFGPRADGTHNNGINIAVPVGAEVHAAEKGVVIYAGDGVATYGHLLLIRHDNGWVTAYAHNDRLTVQRDDVVVRGQVIATAGKSGDVDRPQLHFEIRRGSKPIDPLPHLDSL